MALRRRPSEIYILSLLAAVPASGASLIKPCEAHWKPQKDVLALDTLFLSYKDFRLWFGSGTWEASRTHDTFNVNAQTFLSRGKSLSGRSSPNV